MTKRQLFGAVFREGVAASPPTPDTLSLNHFDASVLQISRVTPQGWMQETTNILSRVTPTGWDQSPLTTNTTTDEVGGITWTLNGGAALNSDQKMFGSSSLFFPASAGGGAFVRSGSWTSPHAGDWTWECFFRAGAASIFVATIVDPTFLNIAVSFAVDKASPQISASYVDSGGSTFLTQLAAPTINADTWYHAAVVRFGNDYYLYFDGNRVDSDTDATDVRTMSDSNMNEANGVDFWVDERRVSKVARYTGATYTIPAAPFTVD